MIYDSDGLAASHRREIIEEDTYRIRALDFTPDLVLDIGANHGMFSLVSRVFWPKARIFAVEPHPQTFKGLCTNVLNLGVTCLRAALGEEGLVDPVDYQNSEGNRVRPNPQGSTQALPLGQIVEALKCEITPRTLIKLDCEGGEECLFEDEQARSLLARSRYFVMELHGLGRGLCEWKAWLEQGFGQRQNTIEYTWTVVSDDREVQMGLLYSRRRE